MHFRRLATFLIGAWLAASVLLDFCAIQNFHQVDRFLESVDAAAAQQIHTLGGRAEARVFLRREVGELNGFLFEQWEIGQLVLGLLVLGVFIFGSGEVPRIALFLVMLMLAIVALDRFYLTPEITRLGRLAISDQTLFWRLHSISSGLELAKLAAGVVAAASLLIRYKDRKRFVREHEKITRVPAPAAQG
jgi:hypothetical protein